MPTPDERAPLPDPAGRVPLDREAFAVLFRRFYGPLHRYARRITGDGEAAADALQDVFLKLWERRRSLSVRVSLQALLYTMVRNRALNMNRRTRRFASEFGAETALNGQAASDAAADLRLAAADLRKHMDRWIRELPPRRAEAFVLSRRHGLTHREIAAIMGVSERTVDTHILLALRDLRGRLDTLDERRTTP